MNCSYCGAELREAHKFCVSCGKESLEHRIKDEDVRSFDETIKHMENQEILNTNNSESENIHPNELIQDDLRILSNDLAKSHCKNNNNSRLVIILVILSLTLALMSWFFIFIKTEKPSLKSPTENNNLLNTTSWEKIFGDNNYDSANSVQQTSDGGYILAGKTLGMHGNMDNTDALVFKLDATGKKEWVKTFGGEKTGEIANSVQQTSDGGYIVAGSTHYKAWLIKLDINGNKTWDKRIEKYYGSIANTVQQTSNGEYVIGGAIYLNEEDNSNAWLGKFNSYGEIIWDKTFKEPHIAQSVQQTTDTGYILVGYAVELNKPNITSVLKLDELGNIQWEKVFIEDVKANSVQQTSDGGFVIAGDSNWKNTWILKLDSSGNKIWENFFGGASREEANTVQQTSDGGYIVAGEYYVSSEKRDDIKILKLDKNGNLTGISDSERLEPSKSETNYDNSISSHEKDSSGDIFIKESSQIEWYIGGTLHKSTSSQWNSASYHNKLATAADFATVIGKRNGIIYSDMSQLKYVASNLEICISDSVSSSTREVKISDVAATCAIMMD